MYWLPAIAWMGVIFYLSGQTQGQLHNLFPFLSDLNWGHVAAYFVLAGFFRYALAKSRAARPGMGAVVLSLLYGLTDEFHQSFVPTRQPDMADILADLLGAVLAVVLYGLYLRRQGQRRANHC